MPLIARQRSRLAVLAVLALVGSLLAVSAVPAVAAGDGEPSQEAEASACVGAAEEDAGFTDMGGSFAGDAANCLAHYGITVGTSEGVFDPSASITRLQMALFMVRAAGVAGVEIDDPENQGFADIGGLTDAIQDAINQATALEIMSGSDGAFDPLGTVNRQDMAVILRGLIDAANGDDFYDVDEDDADQPFSDLGTVPFASYNSINELYELGVAAGTGDGSTFSPTTLVRRDQMAVFVTRALDHTNARPAGISIQGEASGDTDTSHTLTVSVRDEDHQPVPDALIDVISSTNSDEAFDDDGECVAKHTDGNCMIGDEDTATEPEGNVEVAVMLPAEPGSVTVWAWSGEVDDEFDADETDSATIWIDAALPATKTKATDDMKEHATMLQFGDTVTYTLQLVDDNDDPVAKEGIEVTIRSLMDDTTVAPNERPDTRTNEAVHKTDAAGRIEVSYSADDPDSDNDNQDQMTLTLTLTVADPDLLNKTTGAATEESATATAMWSDNDSEAETLALAQAVKYHETDDDGVRNTVTATLVDQYGDPIKNKKVALWSDETVDDAGLGGSANMPADNRTTSKSGVATKSYSRSLSAGADEEVDASFLLVRGKCVDTETDPVCDEENDSSDATTDELIAADAITHYWAVSLAPASGQNDPATTTGSDVVVVDTDNNNIVISSSATNAALSGDQFYLVTYKAGDHFQIGGAASTMDAFEKALDDMDTVAVTIGDDEDDINTFNIDG